MRPHGVDLSFGYEILGTDKKVIRKNNTLQGFVQFENLRSGEKVLLPMRSFVNGFINKLHGILSGDSGADTKISRAAVMASENELTASTVSFVGILVGTDDTNPTLGDTGLGAKITPSASFIYGATTFIEPNQSNDLLTFEVRRLFTDTVTVGHLFGEAALMSGKRGRASFASIASVTGVTSAITMLARDNFPSAIAVSNGDDIRMTFKFKASQTAGGGVLLNLVKLIYNLMIVGDEDNTTSRLVGRTGSAQTFTYGIEDIASLGNPWYIGGGSEGQYIGIVTGNYGTTPPTSEESLAPQVSNDDTTFTVNHTNLTLTTNTISTVTNPSTDVASFTITRDFTNSSTVNKYVDRVGILTRSSAGTGSSLSATQCFLAMNDFFDSPTTLVIEPGQVLRVTYTFQIKV